MNREQRKGLDYFESDTSNQSHVNQAHTSYAQESRTYKVSSVNSDNIRT
jgi:hypothetical protein